MPDEHFLELQVSTRSNRYGAGDVGKMKHSNSEAEPESKLLVRKIVFEATPAEMRRLFSSFLQSKMV